MQTSICRIDKQQGPTVVSCDKCNGVECIYIYMYNFAVQKKLTTL